MIQTDNKNYSKIPQYQGKENDTKRILLSDKNQKEYREISNKLRNYWEIGKNAAAEVNKILNKLIAILHDEHPSWSITKIAYTICIQHEDLEGFSRPTILSKLDDDNRRLLYNKGGKGLPTKSYNNEPKNSAFKINREEKKHNFATAYQFKNSESNTRTNDNEPKKKLDKAPESLDQELEQKNEQRFDGNDVYLTQYHHDLQTTKQSLYEARMQIEEQDQKIQELTIKNLNFNADKIVTKLCTLDYKDKNFH